MFGPASTRTVLALVSLLALAAVARAEPPPADELTPLAAMRQDVLLRAMFFGTSEVGWVVGDRGTIWHTRDGGRTWQLQHSGSEATLTGVWFVDPQRGWVVGRRTIPYTHATSGILLATDDAGRTWNAVPEVDLPGLNHVRMFDDRQGVALGDTSARFPSGVFTTGDGGKHWNAAPAEANLSWLAGDFSDPLTGVLAGRQGALATLYRRSLRRSRTPNLGLRSLRDVKLASPRDGWLVGDGGLVMRTSDSGVSWQLPPSELPHRQARQFDLAAVAVRGSHVWLAGTPGTIVFHSGDGGQTWDPLTTGQCLPIECLSFVDQRHGWAAGALGTILATDDGGRTWRRQRCGGTRAALLGLLATPEAIPLEGLANWSGEDGYLSAIEILTRGDVESPVEAAARMPERTHEAVVGAGGSMATTAWQFPIRSPQLRLSTEQLVAGLDEATDGHGLAMLQEHLVRSIRIWRPDVIVTHAEEKSDGKSDDQPAGDPAAQLIHKLVALAIEQAADGTQYTDQLVEAGLRPHRASKVFALAPSGRTSTVDLTTSTVSPRLGRSLAEQAGRVRRLIAGEPQPSEPLVGFDLLSSRLSGNQGSGLFAGLALQPGGEARRALSLVREDDVQALWHMAQTTRNLSEIIRRSDENDTAGDQLLAQAETLTRPLDSERAGQVLFQLAERYHRRGRGDLAANTLELLLEQHPNHSLSDAAVAWLCQYYASGEQAWRHQATQRVLVQQATAAQPIDARPILAESGQIVRASDLPATVHGNTVQGLSYDESRGVDRTGRAAALAKTWAQRKPALLAEPRIAFPLAAADRARGYPQAAERYYYLTSRARGHDVWRDCALTELWIAQRKGVAAKPVWPCFPASLKPRLDGQLDDAVWKGAKRMTLRSPRGDDERWPATISLAYDKQFLYLAVECRVALGAKYPQSEDARPRDPDLAGQDRVELLLDIDRDWATAYRLVVDHRGWCGESCWGDPTWNPTWFVAAKKTADTWRAEAAIPLDQLSGRPPRARDAWAVGVQRIVPGVGFQSWSRPASPEGTPEGFGLLLFE